MTIELTNRSGALVPEVQMHSLLDFGITYMELNPVHELLLQVQHGDLALANRRLLDLCFDTNNSELIRQAIQLSKAIRKQLHEGNKEDAAKLLDSEIKRLGEQIAHAE